MYAGPRRPQAGSARFVIAVASLISTALLLGAYNWSRFSGPGAVPASRARSALQLATGSVDISNFGNDLSTYSSKLLLASHNRLSWYTKDGTSILHEGEGVYHGIFAGSSGDLNNPDGTAWVLSRPHNWRPRTSTEHLLHLDLKTGVELTRVQIPSRFAHDAVRWGSKVYICSTGSGEIVELRHPDMTFVRIVRKVSRQLHINALAPDGKGSLWALFHRHGQSELVQIKLSNGKITQRIVGFGHKAHGLVLWNHQLLSLDSANCTLVLVNPSKKTVSRLWQAPEPGSFAKGLSVVDDVAYFGISPFAPRSARSDPALDCQLAAFHLLQHRLLWRIQVPTRGLLNAIGAPHLGLASPYRAMRSQPHRQEASSMRSLLWWSGDKQDKYCSRHAGNADGCQADARCELVGERCQGCSKKLYGCGLGLVKQRELPFTERDFEDSSTIRERRQKYRKQQQQKQRQPGGRSSTDPIWGLGKTNAELLKMLDPSRGYLSFATPRGGTWASGVPRMDNGSKRLDVLSAGVRLDLLRVDVSALKAAVQQHWEHVWDVAWIDRENARITGREKNLQRYKPGTADAALIFSDNMGRNVFRFPLLELFQTQLDPILNQVLGAADVGRIMRLQLTLMPAGTLINVHQDMGGYAKSGHRIHVPLIVDGSDTLFLTCPTAHSKEHVTVKDCISLPLQEGEVFELNNMMPHALRNEGPGPRLHLIIDISDRMPSSVTTLRKGQVCEYVKGSVKCKR